MPSGGCEIETGDAGRLRSLCRQPRHRRLHPDRPRRRCARPRPAWSVESLRRGRDVHRHAETVDAGACAPTLKGQRPLVVWLTGLPGSGKSTIANLVERKLAALGRQTMLLDGDNLRQGLNADLGFDRAGAHRERAARRRGRQADGRCRPDRDRGAGLALPGRPHARRGAAARGAASSRSSSMRRSRSAASATPRASMPRPSSGKIVRPHRPRPGLRAARGSGAGAEYNGNLAGGGGRPHRQAGRRPRIARSRTRRR